MRTESPFLFLSSRYDVWAGVNDHFHLTDLFPIPYSVFNTLL